MPLPELDDMFQGQLSCCTDESREGTAPKSRGKHAGLALFPTGYDGM
jgi:hypothetical protein